MIWNYPRAAIPKCDITTDWRQKQIWKIQLSSIKPNIKAISKNVKQDDLLTNDFWFVKYSWVSLKKLLIILKCNKFFFFNELMYESPLDCKKIKLVNPKGNQLWIFTGGTDAEADAPVFWQPDAKSRLTGKVPDAGRQWRQKEKQAAEDEMVR